MCQHTLLVEPNVIHLHGEKMFRQMFTSGSACYDVGVDLERAYMIVSEYHHSPM
jgi:hypothetical protein